MFRAFVYRVPGENTRCPACGSWRLLDLDLLPIRRPGRPRQMGFVSGCDECGLVFSNPLPSVDELKDFYSPAGVWRPGRVVPPPPYTTDAHEKRGRSWTKPFNPIRDELRVWAPPSGSRVLDFGCGTGKLLDAFQEHGWETWGIETAVDEAFRRHGRLEAVPDEPTFDMIVANHVLEHVTDPLRLLQRFARCCRPGGYLFVGVPRFDTLPLHRGYAYVINGRAHVVAYTSTCLQGLLARSGWAEVAPSPDRVAKGRGRTTCSRLQVIARRVNSPPALPPSPLNPALEALRQYHASVGGRSILARLGLHRLQARMKNTRVPHRRREPDSSKTRVAVL